jgi:poly-gamma-glutamate capsule biosynthesis protein CapA/YwtB (metallophosphatase superfamily)
LQDIAGMVQGAIGIVNLEGPVTERLPQDQLRLWNAPRTLAELSALEIKVAGIANNHALDAGSSGAEQTQKRLREAGILPAGSSAGPALFRVNDLSIVVTAHDLTEGVPAELETDLASARAHADVLIATFHVTGPPSYLPRPELRHAAEIAYHAGANLIVAHGTHALGPVERRSHAVIAWGLGNVAFACDCTQEEDATLLRVTIARDTVVSAQILPLQAGINNRRAELASDPGGIFDLLKAIGSNKLERRGRAADF